MNVEATKNFLIAIAIVAKSWEQKAIKNIRKNEENTNDYIRPSAMRHGHRMKFQWYQFYLEHDMFL